MQKSQHDIYRTRRGANPSAPVVTEGSPGDSFGKLWLEELRKSRRNAILFGAVVFGFVLLILIIFFQQYLLMNRPSFEERPSPIRMISADPHETRPARSMSYLDFSIDRESMFLLDELQESTPLTRVEASDMPLNADWIKQAAYHVVMAEKAEREQLVETALEHYHHAVRIFPGLKGIHSRIGLLQMQKKAYADAAKAFEIAREEEVLSFGIANNLAVAYMQLERNDRAEENLLHAIRLRPSYSPAYFNLARLYERREELDKASDYYRQFIEMEPENLGAMMSYAQVLILLQNWPEAVNQLQELGRLTPESPPVQFRLAQALSHTGNRQGAIDALYRAVALVDPRNALAWLSRNEFDLIRSEPRFQQLVTELSSGRR